MRVEPAPEIQVGEFVVAFTHAPGCADDGPDGEAAAEGDEGLFAEAAPYFVECVFVVEVAEDILVFMVKCLLLTQSD